MKMIAHETIDMPIKTKSVICTGQLADSIDSIGLNSKDVFIFSVAANA